VVKLLAVGVMLQPGAEFGSVIVVLQQEEHKTFSRKSHDLYVTHQLGMTEALCGMQFVIQQLDGRNLVLSSPPGLVIEPGLPCMTALQYHVYFISSRCNFSGVTVVVLCLFDVHCMP